MSICIIRELPVYRIETSRLVLRCWEPGDAPVLLEAIAVSLDHLRPWMPWAVSEPEDVAKKCRRIQRWRARFDRGQDFLYGIFNAEQTRVLGAIGSHRRIGSGASEIGYWIRAEHVRQGLATEAAAALTRIGFELDNLHRMEIHCDPQNIASAGVPRKLGYANTVNIPGCVPNAKTPPRDTAVWSLSQMNYADSPAARVALEAFDALGNRVL